MAYQTVPEREVARDLVSMDAARVRGRGMDGSLGPFRSLPVRSFDAMREMLGPGSGSHRRRQAAASLHGTAGNQAVRRLVQANLRVESQNDPREREANRLAEDASRPNIRSALLESLGETRIQPRPQRSADGLFPIEHLLGSEGERLDARTRIQAEGRLGFDFGDVRIHTGSAARETALGLGARAYTIGNHIVLGERFSPGSIEGTRLLAHELGHVIQGSAGGPVIRRQASKTRVETPQDELHVAQRTRGEGAGMVRRQAVDLFDPSVGLDWMYKRAQMESALGPPGGGLQRPDLNEYVIAMMEEDVEEVREALIDGDEEKALRRVRKWAQMDEAHQQQTGYRGTDHLDKFLFLLKTRKFTISGLRTAWQDVWTNGYDLCFLELEGSRLGEFNGLVARSKRQGTSGAGTELTEFFGMGREDFFGAFWEDVESGEVALRIRSYFVGMFEAGKGLVEGVATLLTDPMKLMKGIANLPHTIKVLWRNRDELWSEFVNAEPDEQARMIGRLFGEAEILIATAGAGGGGAAASAAPELASAAEIVQMGRGAALAALTRGGAITIDLGKLGEAGRLTSLMAQSTELSAKGKQKAEELEGASSAEPAPQGPMKQPPSPENVKGPIPESKGPHPEQAPATQYVKDTPNSITKPGDYVYKPDDLGRPVHAEGWVGTVKGERVPAAQDAVAGGLDGYDAGHLIPDRYGGSGQVKNLVAMDSRINKSYVSTVENAISRELSRGPVYLKVNVKYGDASSIPSSVEHVLYRPGPNGSLKEVFRVNTNTRATPSKRMGDVIRGKEWFEPGRKGTAGEG